MRRTLLLSVLAACLVTKVAGATTRTIPNDYASIQEGINASTDGDIVLVLPGMYLETIDFMGKDITVTSSDPNDPLIVGNTIIAGQGAGSVVTFANGETENAVLSGLTLVGGTGSYNAPMSTDLVGARTTFGGGVYCFRSSPTITRNTILGNTLLFNVTGPTVEDVDYTIGGGIGSYEGNPVITYNTIESNWAYLGGGIGVYFGEPIIHGNIVIGNSAYAGGGIFSTAGTIYHNTIVGNDCAAGGGDGIGGNMYVVFAAEYGYTQVVSNIIANASSGGGVLYEGDSGFGLFAYNDVWGNQPQDYLQEDFTGINGNISADPLFVAAGNGDYHLSLDSPCIDAGYSIVLGEIDIDGDARIHGPRTDIGADEYAGYVKPVASAGRNVHRVNVSELVTLDGSDSFFYDPNGPRNYEWTQVSGPGIVLDDPSSPTPSFMPSAAGEYVFELVVSDGQYSSEPDQVHVLVGPNLAPVADAGDDRAVQAPSRVSLDGSRSYDQDPIDELTFIWTQLEGSPVVLADADTAEASFICEAGQVYVFELIVSDGLGLSEPSQVRIVALGATRVVTSVGTVSSVSPYIHYPDVSGTKVVGAADNLSDYNYEIFCCDIVTGQTETFNNPGIGIHPRIDGDLVVWAGGVTVSGGTTPVNSSVFARNVATGKQVVLGSYTRTDSFNYPAISGTTVVWIEHHNIDRTVPDLWRNTPYDICGADISDLEHPRYFTIAEAVGRRDPFPAGQELYDYDRVVDICGDTVVWEGDGDIFAADISDLDNIEIFTVCGDPGRQHSPAVWGDYVVWMDRRNGIADIYGADISDPLAVNVFAIAQGEVPHSQPVIDGAVVVYVEGNESSGSIKMACITRNYGVLTLKTPDITYGTVPALDGSTLVSTSSIYSPVRVNRVVFGYSVFDGAFENATTGQRYDYLRHAVLDARDGGVIVVPEGLHTEKIDFAGNAVTLRSSDPNDPAVVAATVLTAGGTVVTFSSGEQADTVLEGLTVAGGNRGIFCKGAAPTIRNCTITDNLSSGVRMLSQSRATLLGCSIVGNGGDGVDMRAEGASRAIAQNSPVLVNCLIAGNVGAGVGAGTPALDNCTVVENLREGVASTSGTLHNCILYYNDPVAGNQIGDVRFAATYCDIEGGWSGAGNINADPAFAQLGLWGDSGWLPGDYHLKSELARWDSASRDWVSDDVTSPCIDAGDPASPVLDEPTTLPSGAVTNSRINMGTYGGTAEASVR